MSKNRKNFYNSFSIVLPVLNEEKNIHKLIFLINKNLRGFRYEIIFVDDNSKDNTKKVIKYYVSKNIKYYLRKKNNDLTLSCFFGIKKSQYRNIIIMDSDLQHHPKYLPKMINIYLKKNADFVVAVRNFKKDMELGTTRKYTSIFLSFTFNFFLGHRVSDPMSGFFMFKKNIYNKHKNILYGKGWKILADLIYNKENFLIKELPFKFFKRSASSSKMSLEVLINIIKLFIYKYKLLRN
jgi:dolichol-phosphate mannosyltransferase